MKLFLCLAFLVAVALAAPDTIRLVKRDSSGAASSSAANAASTTIVQIQNGPQGGYGGGYPVSGGNVDAQRDQVIQAGAQQVIEDAARPFQSAASIFKGFVPGG